MTSSLSVPFQVLSNLGSTATEPHVSSERGEERKAGGDLANHSASLNTIQKAASRRDFLPYSTVENIVREIIKVEAIRTAALAPHRPQGKKGVF